LGQIIIYGLGLIGLLLTTGMTGMESLQTGVIDFLPGATLKLIAAGLLLELLEWYKERRRGKFQYFKY
jgi:biotin transporter BioY